MPKILINEVDNTSAGTPGRYGNYAVLVTGYQKQFAADAVTAAESELTAYNEAANRIANGDKTVELPKLSEIAKVLKARQEKAITDGAYEFRSIADFKEVTGYDEADITKKDVVAKIEGDTIKEYHYGNRMAYELLKLGYQVIYKVIDKVTDMVDFDKCWADFKDKATYDFRFVSHGLGETCYDSVEYANACAKRDSIKADIDLLREIEKEAGIEEGQEVFKLSEIVACDAIFSNKQSAGNFGSFSSKDVYDVAFTYYHVAAGFTLPTDLPEDWTKLTAEQLASSCTKNDKAGIAQYLTRVEADIDEANKTSITIDAYNIINGNIASLASYRVKEDDGTILCDGRGDCTALIELDENEYISGNGRPETLIIKGINVLSTNIGDNGAYCALTVPSVYYANGMKLPGAFHYLACFMSSLGSGFAEWYAAAGYNRGVSSYAVDHTSVKLGEIAINALEPRYRVADPNKVQPMFACNVIANFRGSYYLWGNRTAATLGSYEGGDDLTAEHFLNIRQLCSTIKKQLYVACRRFTFDPNSDTLWFNFINAITPTLDAMKADQGIGDYKIVKVKTDKKATLKARIRIIPIEAVEDFDITISLEDSFGGVTVTAEG